MEAKKDIEVFKMNLNARSRAELGNVFRARAAKVLGKAELSKENLGFEVPDKFLRIDGPQPLLAELTVLANKLKMQIAITHVELKTLEDVEAEKAAAEKK